MADSAILADLAEGIRASIRSGQSDKAMALLANLESQLLLQSNVKDSPPRDDSLTKKQNSEFSVRVCVEDRQASLGSFLFQVQSTDTVADLKSKFWQMYKIPVEVQRWIIGQRIPKDSCTMYNCGIKGPGVTLFLYLVMAHSVGLKPPTSMEYEAHSRDENSGSFYAASAAASPASSSPATNGGFAMASSSNRTSLYARSTNSNSELDFEVLSAASDMSTLSLSGMLPTSPSTTARDPLAESKTVVMEHMGGGIVSPLLHGTPSPTEPLPSSNLTSKEPEEPAKVGWNCPQCTFINLPTRPGCEICSTARPDSYQVPGDYQMTQEEAMRIVLDEELEKRTRAPAVEGLTYDQKQDNLLMLRLAEERRGAHLYPDFSWLAEAQGDGFFTPTETVWQDQADDNGASKSDGHNVREACGRRGQVSNSNESTDSDEEESHA